MTITVTAEDKYNFNKGMRDTIFGIKDEWNARLETVGLAKGYRQSGFITKSRKWKSGKYAKMPVKPQNPKNR